MEKVQLNTLVSGNQTIKIVPSVEDSLRSMGLNVQLDDNIISWLNQIQIAWKTWKKSINIERKIESLFQSLPDPFQYTLTIVIKCEDFKDCKPKSLPYFITETLLKWAQQNELSPKESLKLPAFCIATQQRNQHYLNLIVKTYQLSTIKPLILPMVKDMTKNNNYKQASQVVISMELFDDIPVEDLLFPLLLQDKNNMVDEYLTECPDQVKPLLSFLDKLLDKNFALREFVQNYIEENKISHIKHEKIHYKPLGKLVARLCNKFNIPIETCKNLSKNRTTGGLRYLIHQKYQEHSISASVWDDLIKDSLRQNADSAQEFIDMLLDYDKNEALKWAEYLNLSDTDLPVALKEISFNDIPEQENWDEDINSTQEYYKLAISRDKIIMIDTAEIFYDMFTDLKNCHILSIDCEWKPCFGATQSQVALIQVATIFNVYLIDTLLLNKPQFASFWYKFYKSILDNAEIIKLGFGLEQDLKEIKASIVGLGNIKVQGEGLLDLCILWKNLLSNGLILPMNSENGGSSLSSLAQSCFGLPVKKSEQCSNWEIRPLRETQIEYAALDAHILIVIYEYFQKLSHEQKLNFEEICNDVMLERKKKFTKKSKVIERIPSTIPSLPTKAVNDVKFLIQPEISQLVAYLRFCGIDSCVMPTTLLWHDVINLATSEDRLILLNKLKYSPTINFPQSSILDVGKGTITEQLHKIFHTFNINVKQKDLFTLCVQCNSNNLKKLDPDKVQKICNDYNNPTQNSQDNNRYGNDCEDEEYDNFLSDSDCDDLWQNPVHHLYTPRTCKTSKGIEIEIDNAHKLSTLKKEGVLCEECGKLYWDEDKLFKVVSGAVYRVTNLSII